MTVAVAASHCHPHQQIAELRPAHVVRVAVPQGQSICTAAASTASVVRAAPQTSYMASSRRLLAPVSYCMTALPPGGH